MIHAKGSGEIGHKRGINPTLAGTGFMIEVNRDQPQIPPLMRQAQQRNAVGAAAGANPPRSGRNAGNRLFQIRAAHDADSTGYCRIHASLSRNMKKTAPSRQRPAQR